MQAETLGADDDLVSQVLEIIGGAVYEAPPTPEEEQGGGAWPTEEGDDSVFYSDEDQGGGTGRDQDTRAFTKGIPEVEEDRTPRSEQSGAKPEEDRTTEVLMEDASGTADPLKDEDTTLQRPNLLLPEPAHVDAPAGFPLRPGPGYSTLPTPKTSFNHLTSSKYDTVSYRRIRRGNTRQKIQKFEYMILNL